MRTLTRSAYRRSAATSWTRIDMLLALYDAAIFTAQHGQKAAEANNVPNLLKYRHRSQRLVAELIDGVDVAQGEMAQNVHRLLSFCLLQTCENDAPAWASAVSILSTLRDAFREIREQAVTLEQTGQIPSLNQSPLDETLAVS